MSTATIIRGIVKKKLQDKEGKTKAGKKWVKKTFIVTPEDGGKDLFISTFGKFDNALIGKTIEVEAEQFNDTSYNAKSDPVSVEGDTTTSNEEVPGPTPTKPVVEGVSHVVKSEGVDWAAKDRAMAAGGILHDAAALVAPTVTKTTKLEDILANVQNVAVGLVAVKRAVEEALK